MCSTSTRTPTGATARLELLRRRARGGVAPHHAEAAAVGHRQHRAAPHSPRREPDPELQPPAGLRQPPRAPGGHEAHALAERQDPAAHPLGRGRRSSWSASANSAPSATAFRPSSRRAPPSWPPSPRRSRSRGGECVARTPRRTAGRVPPRRRPPRGGAGDPVRGLLPQRRPPRGRDHAGRLGPPPAAGAVPDEPLLPRPLRRPRVRQERLRRARRGRRRATRSR